MQSGKTRLLDAMEPLVWRAVKAMPPGSRPDELDQFADTTVLGSRERRIAGHLPPVHKWPK